MGELLRRDPANLVVIREPELSGEKLGPVSAELNLEVRIVMAIRSEKFSRARLNGKFLTQLALQGFFRALSIFDFSSRELP